nr:V-set and immunoglobulin domain-containing protein 10-like [Labrus bergylta]
MTKVDKTKRFSEVFLFLLLSCTFQGTHCELVLSPTGHTVVNAEVGRNVTLAVSFSGATDPVVAWFMKDVPVITWTFGSSPIIDGKKTNVLRLEPNGSLTFVNVSLEFSSNYTFEITKAGLKQVSTTFTLNVFEIIQNVTLRSEPDLVIEGTDRFMLEYSMSQGVVQQQTWFYNGREIQTNSNNSKDKSLVILRPTRSDTGQYSVFLTNPFGSVTTYMNVTVLYGPEDPKIQARPAQPFYVSGDSLLLSCLGEGSPKPSIEWIFGGQNISRSAILNLTNVKTGQGGDYTCMLLNELTKNQSQISFTLDVYERPSENPLCSVQSVNNNVDLQYHCQWSGGTPQARLFFPELDNSKSGLGNLSLTVNASENLDGRTFMCLTEHPIEKNKCNITASSPLKFLPTVQTTVNFAGKIVVSIHCVSEASPSAVVLWSRGSEAVTNGTTHQISSDTTQLQIRDYNVSNFLLQNYTCTCKNPLGGQRREIQLRGPSISNSNLFPNQDGTILTLTWEVPPYSVVTGFDIQMKGPDLQSKNRYDAQSKGKSNGFQTIQWKPGSARSADIFDLNPKLTYRFQVIPKALRTDGEPSEVHRIGPGEGLSGPAIAGLAAGIPCSLLFLLLLAFFIYRCVHYHKNRSRQTRYPVSRAVEKAIPTQTDSTPHNLLTGGLKAPPDYNRFQQAPSERSVDLPSFVPPPPVRVATTV